MQESAKILRLTLDAAQRAANLANDQVKQTQAEIEQYERNCVHDWTEPKSDPAHLPGGYDPGDPPGTMGVDRRLPCSWPAKTIPRWTRTCRACGKVQETKETKDVVSKSPVFH